MSTYGWIITRDHLATDPLQDGIGDAATMGPSDITPELKARLRAGDGRTFRMRDDDGELYYTGRLIGGDGFEPLDDFGMPNAGATSIEYRAAGSWVIL